MSRNNTERDWSSRDIKGMRGSSRNKNINKGAEKGPQTGRTWKRRTLYEDDDIRKTREHANLSGQT